MGGSSLSVRTMAGSSLSVPAHLATGLPRSFVEKRPEKQQAQLDPAQLREITRKLDEERIRLQNDPAARAAKKEMQRKTWKQAMRFITRGPMDFEAESRILDSDPKQGGVYHFRVHHFHRLSKIDFDAESPLGPMRFTNDVYKDNAEAYRMLCEAVNIFTLKIASLDVAFPIHVYGTVLARDDIDSKCVYLFRRDRDNCQLISSKDESLILTGPKRGLSLISPTYVETNLKIKSHEGQKDRELSKGFLTISGMERRELKKSKLESCSLATKLSTVDMMYSVVKRAVEATFAFEVIQGDFYGEIYACTSTISNALVLHASELVDEASGCSSSKCADVMEDNGTRTIQLLQAVVSVSVNELLIVAISNKGPHCRDDHGIKTYLPFVPSVNGCSESCVAVGPAKISMKIVWSRIDF